MIHKSTNGRILLISDRVSAISDLGDYVPVVIILTAWTPERASVLFWEALINYLLSKGAMYIACIGTFSELLHDEIDEFVEQNGLLHIVTTFHANDTMEEAVDFCVYGTDLNDQGRNCILAVLDEQCEQDKDVKTLLSKA